MQAETTIYFVVCWVLFEYTSFDHFLHCFSIIVAIDPHPPHQISALSNFPGASLVQLNSVIEGRRQDKLHFVSVIELPIAYPFSLPVTQATLDLGCKIYKE